MKKVMLAGALALTVSLLGVNPPAYAHFPVEDDATGVKAIFHVTPDHDPIAGKESVISFDFSKTGYRSDDFTFSLAVKSTKGESVAVPVAVVGNVVMANYAFPHQGFYDIKLNAVRNADGSIARLSYGQRVTRGTEIERQESSSGAIETAAVAGTIAIAIGAVTYSLISDRNKRKAKRNDSENHG